VEDARTVGVALRDGTVLRASSVLDASGQRCLAGRQFGLVEDVPDLRATATYAYFDGAGGVPGPLARHVQFIVTVPEGWVWFIPISPARTSVGVVVRARTRLEQSEFLRIVNCAGVPIAAATLVDEGDPLFHVRDWSYALRRSNGPGWMALGDAACFVDPILSGGVDFAIRGALNAAVALLRVRDGADEAATFAATDERLRREYRAYLRLARYWYGNNRSVSGFFWEAHQELGPESLSTPLRAFVYLTSGRYAADNHLRVFQQWQEERMFRALGVDGARVQEAVRARRGGGDSG
jgi:clorobiocin biosynthesis protein Clo-hal